MAIDYEAMNQRITDLAEQNAGVFEGTTPDVQQQKYDLGGMGGAGRNTVTTTPGEYSEIQKALSGQSFTLGGYTPVQGEKGTPKLTTGVGGQQALSFMRPGGTLTRPSESMRYPLNTPQAQANDQLLQAMREVGINNPEALIGRMDPMKKAQMSASLQDYGTQKESFGQQAQNYAAGMKTLGEGVASMGQELEQTSALIKSQMGQGLSPTWERAIGKADEYVTNAQNRTVQAMNDLDNVITSMRDNMQFEKAHDMQVATQAALGQMNSYGDTIARRYGEESPEYQQFTQQKSASLATTQSSIHSTYGQLNASMNQGFLTARTGLASNMAMYENYNEQASLDVYKAAAAADQQFELNATSQLVAIEQLKMSGQTLLADWMANTPVFSMSLSGLFALM